MNKHLVNKMTKKKLEVKKYSKEEAKALAKKMGLEVSDKYGEESPKHNIEKVESNNEN